MNAGALVALLMQGQRAVALALLVMLALLLPAPLLAQTYTSASTSFEFIDSSSHTKIGFNTTPYKFNRSAGCPSTPPVLDDTLSDLVPIGFTFRFGTVDYTTLRINSNGRLQFGNTACGAGTASIGPPQTYPLPYPNATLNNTMKVFAVDLDHTNLADRPNYPSSTNKTPCTSIATCYVSIATLGSAPTRQFVVTWKNVPEWVNATTTSGSFDLQVILNEDGSFIFQYGNIVHGGTGTAQIGWQLTTTNYQVLAFGASAEPPPNTAIKFFLPAPLAVYAFDEGAWLPGVAGQVGDIGGRNLSGTALGAVQTSTTAKVCRSAAIPLNTAAGTVDAVATGVNLANPSLNVLGTGSIAFWYRSNASWTGGTAAQLLDATSASGEFFFLTRTGTGALLFEVKDSTGVTRSVTTPVQSISTNAWVHIVVAWNFNGAAGINQDTLQVIVNGSTAAIASFTSNGTISTQIGTLHLGDNPFGFTDAGGTVNSANGFIDEVLIYNYPLTAAQATAAMGLTRSCASLVIDHFEIQHPSGSGVTCAPTTLTLRACQNAACTVAYTGGVSGSFSATGTPTVNWDGSTGNGSGSGFVIGVGSSSVTKTLQVTTAGSVVLGVASSSPSANAARTCNFGSPSCTFTAADAGFLLAAANAPAEQSQALSISAVRRADNGLACVPALANVTLPVTFRCSYTDPTSGTLPARIGGNALNAGNDAGAACDAGGRAVDVGLDANGVGSTTLRYADVGRLALTASYTATGGTGSGLVLSGSTSFVSRPADFVLSAIRCTSLANCAPALPAAGDNPAASSAAGPAFIQAGQPFTVTARAVNAAGAATPNYGRETAPEGVRLGVTLVAPGGGSAPALANPAGFGSFSGGTASGTAFGWSEVGIIRLVPTVADGDYLGSGNVTGTASEPVGRFIPARFTLGSPTLVQRSALACTPASTFTYLGENFSLGFTLTAQASGGTTTQNYSGAFAKFDPAQAAAWQLAGVAGTTRFNSGNGRLSLGSASGAWSAGVAANVSLTAAALRDSAPDGPFNASFGIAPVDSDGIGLASFDLDADAAVSGNDRQSVAAVPLRFGRLRLLNSSGAADRELQMPVRVEHWAGSSFAENTLDSCTRLPASALSFGNLRRTLTTTDTAASTPNVAISAGRGTLRLAAPAAGRRGTFDIAASLGTAATDASCLQPWTPGSGDAATAGANLAYLRGAWCGTSHDKDPSARASFGLQRGNDVLVYRRENY